MTLNQFLTVVAPAVGGTMALISGLVLLYVRSLRSSYDARVADLKEYNANLLAVVRGQQAVEHVRAETTDKALASGQATEAVLRALPFVKEAA